MLDEKIKFIARLLDGEKLAPLCREFSISRKTGYQIWKKYLQFGQQAFIERWHHKKQCPLFGGKIKVSLGHYRKIKF